MEPPKPVAAGPSGRQLRTPVNHLRTEDAVAGEGNAFAGYSACNWLIH